MILTIVNLEPAKQWMKSGVWGFEAVIMAIIMAITILLIQALLVQIFWNLLLPPLFPMVPCISYWQALLLVLLIIFLFG
jgi:hypothetical protein